MVLLLWHELTWQTACCVVMAGMTQLLSVVKVASALLHKRVTKYRETGLPLCTGLGLIAFFGLYAPAGAGRSTLQT